MTTPGVSRQIITPSGQGDVVPHEHDATEISGTVNFVRILKALIDGDLTVSGFIRTDETGQRIEIRPADGASVPAVTFFTGAGFSSNEGFVEVFEVGGGEWGLVVHGPAEDADDVAAVNLESTGTVRVRADTAAIIEVPDGTEVARFTADGISSARGILGYATRTSNVGTFTTETDMTDLTTTVTVPAGRVIKISAKADFFSSVSGDRIEMRLYEGATQIQRDVHQNAADAETASTFVVREPTADEHTYKVTALRANGTGNITMTAAGDRPAVLAVEDLGAA